MSQFRKRMPFYNRNYFLKCIFITKKEMPISTFIHKNQLQMPLTQLEQVTKKNFGLTEATFNELVRALQQGKEKLFERIYFTHFEYCVNYLINHRGAKYEEAYSSTMNTLLEIRKELIQGKIQYGNLAYFFTYRAGKKLSKMQQRGNTKIPISSIEGMDFKAESNFLEALQTKEMAGYIEKALTELCEDCMQLLRLYYYEGMSWSKIAEIYYPNGDAELILTKSDTLKKRAKRKCLPKFKSLLERLIK